MVKKGVIFGRCDARDHMDPRGHKVRAMEAEKEAANARTFSAIFKNARTFWVISHVVAY
jgi:hypothetical protein